MFITPYQAAHTIVQLIKNAADRGHCCLRPAALEFRKILISLRQHRTILSADTASEVLIRRARCGRCQAKSADNTLCIIEHFGNADAVPQPPERCLSR